MSVVELKPKAKASRARAKSAAPKNCYLRGKTWHAEIVVGRHRFRGSLHTADAAEAVIKAASKRKELEGKAYGGEGEESFKVGVGRWMTEILPRSVKPKTAKRYLSSIPHFDAAFGDMLVSAIDVRAISKWISARRHMGKMPNGVHSGKAFGPGEMGEVTEATIRRDLTALSSVLDACGSFGWIQNNVAREFNRKNMKESRSPIEPPTRAEIDFIISRATPGMAAVIRALSETGCRMEEVCQLERREVDWTDQRITLTVTKSNHPRVLSWVTPGGNVTGVLRAATAQDFLFSSPDIRRGKSAKPYKNFSSNFCTLMRALMVEAQAEAEAKNVKYQFRRWNLHLLRHAFAIRWLRSGGSLHKLSTHLGHGSVKVTERSYLRWLTVDEQARVQSESRRHSLME